MFGERLRLLRKEMNRTQQQIADSLGITRAAYSHFENGRNEPDSSTISKLADIFGVTTDYLYGRSDVKLSNEVKTSGTLETKIPILGRIVASNPEGAEEDYDGEIGIQDSVVEKYGAENLFALRVTGDSMNKVVIPGATAIIHKTTEWKDGDICAVIINGYEATLKRVYRKPNAIRFEPESWNPNQQPWEYTDDMDIYVQILGVYIYSVSGI